MSSRPQESIGGPTLLVEGGHLINPAHPGVLDFVDRSGAIQPDSVNDVPTCEHTVMPGRQEQGRDADGALSAPDVNEQHLLRWSIATRRQLDRWEACVADITRFGLKGEQPPGVLVWQSSAERHMVFVAARNLVRALDLGASDEVDQGLRNTLLDVRNLLEHWDENMAIFNTTPQGSPTRQSERFAATHPDITPDSSFQWDTKVGPKLLPSVQASVVSRALDAVDAWVLGRQPSLEEYVPPSQESPWRGVGWGADQWWPKL